MFAFGICKIALWAFGPLKGLQKAVQKTIKWAAAKIFVPPLPLDLPLTKIQIKHILTQFQVKKHIAFFPLSYRIGAIARWAFGSSPEPDGLDMA